MTYRPEQQHAGMFIAGFDWRLFGTGTFRCMPKHEDEAVLHLNRFADKLSRAMQFKKHSISPITLRWKIVSQGLDQSQSDATGIS